MLIISMKANVNSKPQSAVNMFINFREHRLVQFDLCWSSKFKQNIRERDRILTWYPWKKLRISFIPVLYGKPCIRTNAPGWGRIGVWVAVAAAATAPGGAAIYPTVVGDTGGLKEKQGQNCYENQ